MLKYKSFSEYCYFFRDYHDPNIVVKEEGSDEEYSPSEQNEPKKPRYSRPGKEMFSSMLQDSLLLVCF